jgi:hypothetical protein
MPAVSSSGVGPLRGGAAGPLVCTALAAVGGGVAASWLQADSTTQQHSAAVAAYLVFIMSPAITAILDKSGLDHKRLDHNPTP